MRKYILLLIVFVSIITCYGQSKEFTGRTKKDKDDFIYKKIQVTDTEEGSLSLKGITNSSSSSSSSKFLTHSSAKSMSSGASSGIGETLGELSVSLTGAAQYNIPVAVPPGINGVTPEVSLSYNSQGGNGLAGYGWNISGISTISRVSSTKFHDGNIDGIDFDNLDRFTLDGQRLLLKSGTYGSNGAQYETESYSNVKILSYGTSPYGSAYGPSYFIVYYPDGSLAHYGNSNDSNSYTDYAITYWQNPQGVRISYEYSKSNNNLTISKIKYGSIYANTPINEIRFEYNHSTIRDRPEIAFFNDIEFKRSNILTRIRVYSNGSQYRFYNLTHDNSNLGYTRLIQISEANGDAALSHSPINFNYSDSNPSVNFNGLTTNLSLANIEQRNAVSTSLDLTGNGEMDFIVYPKTKDKFWIFKNIQSGGTNTPYQATGNFEAIFPTTWINSQNRVIPGQGLTVVKNSTNNDVDFKIYSNGTVYPIYYQYTKTWDAPTYAYQTSPTSSTQKQKPNEYVSGDFNGDGLTDVLAIGRPYINKYFNSYPCPPGEGGGGDPIEEEEEDLPPDDGPGQGGGETGCYSSHVYTTNYKGVHFIDLKQDVTTGFVNFAGNLQQHILTDDKIYTGDFNGDGKTDIMHVTNGKLLVYTLSNNNTLTLLWQTDSSAINVSEPIMLGDFNGDGKTDFLDPGADGSNWFGTFLSTGVGFKISSSAQPFTYRETDWNSSSGTLYGYNLIPLDINGDGRTDIVEYNTTTYNSGTNGTEEIKIYNNDGIVEWGSQRQAKFVYAGSTSKTGNLKHYPIPIFLTANQPNKNLEFASISDQWVTNFSFTQDHREDMLLRSISNNGVTQTIDYGNLDTSLYNSQYMQVYQDSYNETYPYVDIHVSPGTKVVTELERICTGTTTLKQLYAYYGAVSNAEGLGFLGFKGIATSNWHTNSSDRIFNVSKHDPLLRGAITDNYSTSGYFNFTVPTSNYISKTTNNISSSLANNKVFKYWITSSLTQNALEGVNTNVTYIYDLYNNPKKVTTDYIGSGSHVNEITYANSTGATYYIGRPTIQKETNTIGSETFITERQFTYTGYLLTERKTKGNGTPFDVETFSYDSFGNIVKKVTTPYATSSREIEFEYDTSGRFLTKLINVEDLETTYQYNTETGTLKNETNPFNQQTSYIYDSWDRLTKVTDYLGNDVTTDYVESNNTYTVTDTGNGGTGSITIYDPLKRVTTSKERNVMGQWVSTSYLYDKFDRIWKTSEPYTSSATQWNEIEYDFYGRPIKQTEYTGRITTITYTGLTTVVNDGTKSITTVKDAMGNTTSVTDPGGTINYTYYGNGNLKTATYNGIVVTVEQDGWGRKTKLIDPSAGEFTYSYNGFGEITSETTPKGTTTYLYSSIGKLTQKQVIGDNTDMTLQYSYNSTNKFLSSLTLTDTNGNNSSYNYTYDNFARLISLTETNTFAQFIKNYTYDAFGRIYTEEYFGKLLSNNKTSTKKIKNIYQNGDLKAIQDYSNNEVLWNISSINARNQITSLTMGNDMREQMTYNIQGYLTENKVEKNVSSAPVELMKLTNNFNVQRGILNSRTNSMFSWSENFTYDSMDRLIDFDDNNDDKDNAYDLLGRITQSSDVGDYAYLGNSYRIDNIDLNNQGDFYFQNKSLQQVTYNAFKKPFEINQNGKEKIGFQYNAFMGRSHMFYGDTQNDILLRNKRKHYSYDGSMEISFDTNSGKTTFVTYIAGDAYNAPVIWRSEQGGSTSEDYYYLHRDYLGSILMISDKNGTIKEKRHFDAWGNTVKLTDGNGENLNEFVYLDRGYTGHEHLQGVDLIHMNGRLYDSKLKRFLAPDNYIQDLSNTQNFNRYSYVLNNPLSNIDPSGEFILETLGLVAILKTIFTVAAVGITAYALFDAFTGGGSSGSSSSLQSSSSGSSNSSQEISSGLGGDYDLDYKYDYSPQGINQGPMPENDMSFQVGQATAMAMFGDIANGNGLNGGDDSFNITTEDIVDTTLDFVPIAGSVKDIYKGIQQGSGWTVAMGVGFLILDVATLGSASLVKGAVKTGIKAGARTIITRQSKRILKKAVKNPQLTVREAQAAIRTPSVAAMMNGKGVDRAYRNFAKNDLILKTGQKLNILQINSTTRGADMVGKKLLNGSWWDVTTSGAWASHVRKYGEGGIPLLY